jgi:hypothetical protein
MNFGDTTLEHFNFCRGHFKNVSLVRRLLTRPVGTLSSIPNGGVGRGEEVLRFMRRAFWPKQKFVLTITLIRGNSRLNPSPTVVLNEGGVGTPGSSSRLLLQNGIALVFCDHAKKSPR